MRKEHVIDLVATLVSDRITAEIIVERLMEEGLLHLGYGDADVDRVVEKFKDTFGTTKTSKQDRWAAHRLVQKYSTQAIVGIIQLLAENSTEKFAPVTNSVSELENKLPSVLNFLRNIKGDETIQL